MARKLFGNASNLDDCGVERQCEQGGGVAAKEEASADENHSTDSAEEDEVAPLPTESPGGRQAVEFVVDSDEEVVADDPFSQRTEIAYLVCYAALQCLLRTDSLLPPFGFLVPHDSHQSFHHCGAPTPFHALIDK